MLIEIVYIAGVNLSRHYFPDFRFFAEAAAATQLATANPDEFDTTPAPRYDTSGVVRAHRFRKDFAR